MRLPTGAIDQTFNLVHKLGSVLLIWCGLAFVVLAGWKILRTGGAVDVFVATELHADKAAGATQRFIQDENTRQTELYKKIGTTVESANGTIKSANSTITKLGTAIEVTQKNLTATTGAVNGTLGEVQTSLSTFRNDLHGTMGKVDASLDHLPPLFIQARTSLKAIDGITASMLPITQNVASATASGAHILHTVDIKTTELAKPKSAFSLAWARFLDAAKLANVLKWILGL
jgi:ABC-type transporter Mla subunit MlaD